MSLYRTGDPKYGTTIDQGIFLKLLDEGHDLWCLYSRGTRYSLTHDKYSDDSAEFWDFSWADMGAHDLKATIDFIYQRKQQKVAMFGYSMGTTQIFSALAAEYDFFRDKVFKVILQAPCTVVSEAMFPKQLFNTVSLNALRAMGIYEVGGPTWPTTEGKIRKLIGAKGMQGLLAGGWGTRLIAIAVKAFDHYAQNAQANRFQVFSDNFYTPVVGKKKTDLFDLSVITETPIAMFMGALDDTCLPA